MAQSSTARKPGATAIASAGLMLAPAVVWLRWPLLMAESRGQTSLGKEGLTAVSEKATALVEGAIGFQSELARSALQFWPELLSGRLPDLVSGAAAARSIDAAFRPASRRVRANYRRLSAR